MEQMVNKEVFKLGIEKLNIEYKDRGFTMTKDKAIQWFDFMKEMDNETFNKKIATCLTTCNHVPFMSDVINQQAVTNSWEGMKHF